MHLGDSQLLVQRAAVDANANRPVIVDGDLADCRELFVPSLTGADVAWVDAVFVQRGRTVRVARQQQMAVVMEIADGQCIASRVEHALLDLRPRRQPRVG